MSEKVLHLTLKKKWFDMIASGEKREEYRELKQYWERRLEDDDNGFKQYDVIQFRNGYQKDAPTIVIKLLGIEVGIGKREWGAPIEFVYKLMLGEIIHHNSGMR